MSWTKRQFVQQAFEELGFSSYSYSLPDALIYKSKYRLDSMMATWNGKGIVLGYPLQSGQTTTDIDDDTEVPDYAHEAIYTNLAIRIAPSVGKQAGPDLKLSAREAYKTLLVRIGLPPVRQFDPILPRGAGNKPWIYDDEYFPEPTENIEIFEGDGVVDLD
jgi:hypothetical protein